MPLPTLPFPPSSQENATSTFEVGKNWNSCNIQVGDEALEQTVVCREFVSIPLSLTLNLYL